MRRPALVLALLAAGCVSLPEGTVDVEGERIVCLTSSVSLRASRGTEPEASGSEDEAAWRMRGRAMGEALKLYCRQGTPGERRAFLGALDAALAPHGVTVRCHPRAW